MSKIEFYKSELLKVKDWDYYILLNSNLPSRRANIELMRAVVELGQESQFVEWLKYDEKIAPTNTQEEFLAFCGTVGLGQLIILGKDFYFQTLRELASDGRWRIREAVAFALQDIGKKEFGLLIYKIEKWKSDNLFVRRAVVAGLCEPGLLKQEEISQISLIILYQITAEIQEITNRREESYRVLRKCLAYAWSVAIESNPKLGMRFFEQLAAKRNYDIQWILRENLKKKRLKKMDIDWVNKMRTNIN